MGDSEQKLLDLVLAGVGLQRLQSYTPRTLRKPLGRSKNSLGSKSSFGYRRTLNSVNGSPLRSLNLPTLNLFNFLVLAVGCLQSVAFSGWLVLLAVCFAKSRPSLQRFGCGRWLFRFGAFARHLVRKAVRFHRACLARRKSGRFWCQRLFALREKPA